MTTDQRLPAFWELSERAICERIGGLVSLVATYRGHPTRDLAQALHITETAMRDRLGGKTPFRSYELARIAEFLAVHPGVFFEHPDDVILGRRRSQHHDAAARDAGESASSSVMSDGRKR